MRTGKGGMDDGQSEETADRVRAEEKEEGLMDHD